VPRCEDIVKDDDLPRFYKAVTELKNPLHRDCILLMLFTGMRLHETRSLRWDDVDFEARLIRVPAPVTKTKKKLDLPMNDLVYDLLKGRKEKFGGTGFIFAAISKTGYLHDPRKSYQIVGKATGIHVGNHDMRRTYLTVAARTPGVTTFTLKGLANHSLGKDVTAGYVILQDSDLREAAQFVGNKLKQLCGLGSNVVELRKAS
jgi:integrase